MKPAGALYREPRRSASKGRREIQQVCGSMDTPGIKHHGDCNRDHHLEQGLSADEGMTRLEEVQKDGPSRVSGEGYSSRTWQPVVKNVLQGLEISDRTHTDEGGLMGFDRLDEPAKQPTAWENKESGNKRKHVNGSEQVHNQISKPYEGSSQPNADVNSALKAVPGGVPTSALELLADTASRTAWLPLARTASSSQLLREEKGDFMLNPLHDEHQHEEA